MECERPVNESELDKNRRPRDFMEWMKNMDELDRGSPVAGSQRGRPVKLPKECEPYHERPLET